MEQFESAHKRSTMKNANKRPAWVQKAVVTNDLESLRHAARLSNEKQAEKRAQANEESAYFREREVAKADAEGRQEAEELREHITPINLEEEEAA